MLPRDDCCTIHMAAYEKTVNDAISANKLSPKTANEAFNNGG